MQRDDSITKKKTSNGTNATVNLILIRGQWFYLESAICCKSETEYVKCEDTTGVIRSRWINNTMVNLK